MEPSVENNRFNEDDIMAAMKVAREAERRRCAEIALAIDSGRGNEKEIARAILAQE